MPQNFTASVTVTPAALDTVATPVFSKFPNKAREVLIQAPTTNTDDILWGDATTQNISIAAGDERIIPVEIIGEIFVASASGTQSLSCAWIV